MVSETRKKATDRRERKKEKGSDEIFSFFSSSSSLLSFSLLLLSRGQGGEEKKRRTRARELLHPFRFEASSFSLIRFLLISFSLPLLQIEKTLKKKRRKEPEKKLIVDIFIQVDCSFCVCVGGKGTG